TYTWPGNVRELDNVMQRALILCTGAVIEAEHVQLEATGDWSLVAGQNPEPAPNGAESRFALARAQHPEPSVLADSLSARERDLILDALHLDNGNRQAVASRLGISARTLRYKLAKLRDAGVDVAALGARS
ncbi:helix-turn-helix domain-containing protein, partial [Povalibacter sp.]|uniref:helix-turn-helix domain-containing protein n=1 Tax=Povalibacter sp. TaxID=1962978 RepID=UPI002F407D83